MKRFLVALGCLSLLAALESKAHAQASKAEAHVAVAKAEAYEPGFNESLRDV
jgi:hypothetical protein